MVRASGAETSAAFKSAGKLCTVPLLSASLAMELVYIEHEWGIDFIQCP